MSISSFKMMNSENSQGSFRTRVIPDYYITDRERRGLKFRYTTIRFRIFEYSLEWKPQKNREKCVENEEGEMERGVRFSFGVFE